VHPIAVAAISFSFIFGGALLGLFLQGLLPSHHLQSESKDAVKLGAGLIATMAALVLGLLVGSAKSSFDAVNSNITRGSAKFIYLDRQLANYGPEATPIRAEVAESAKKIVMFLWPEENAYPGTVPFSPTDISGGLEKISAMIRSLPQKDPDQTLMRSQALQAVNDLMMDRWLTLTQSVNTLPRQFFGMMLFWLTALNITYGLFAPRNATVVAVLLACALAVSGALFLVVEMNRPLTGLIKDPSQPFRTALEFLGK
jgi:hypothetical protein